MIDNQRDKLAYIAQLEALNKRLSQPHKMKESIQETLKKELSGIKGENSLRYYLNFLPPEEYRILHNLRINDSNGYFEMDTILLCQCYILIIESKNWYGSIYFDGEKQVIRVGDNGVEEGLPNPIPQVKTQRFRLQNWLNQNDFPQIPIHYFVVFSSPRTILKPLYPDEPIPKEVIHGNRLFFQIEELDKQIKSSYRQKGLPEIISTALNKAHSPSKVNILEKFSLDKNELTGGVQCTKCIVFPMRRIYGTWHCGACNHKDKYAHIPALQDFGLLFGNEISNEQARAWLGIASPHITKELLIKYCQYRGSHKGRKYKIPIKY